MERLYEYQVIHTTNIINILQRNGRAVDLSATGTGKTFTSITACLELGLRPFIICPKSMEMTWVKILKKLDCPYFGTASYEIIKNGFYIDDKMKRKEIEFMEVKDEKYTITKIPNDVIIIYDEAHKCKNIHTINGKILYEMAKNPQNKILLLSATIADKAIYAILLCYVLRLFTNIEYGKDWISKNIKKHKNYMLGIRDVLFPNHASRMDISEIVEICPENRVIAECYETINEAEIEREYENIKFYVNNLDEKGSGIGFIIKARQKIEFLKIPDFVNLTNYHLSKNKSVVIFVNYTATIKELSRLLNTECLVYGEQDIRTREKNINDFNDDKQRVIICNIKTGGTGLSFHDLNGNHPRVSLISPCWSATDLMQALGRIFRAGVKTECEQYIIFSNCKNERYIQNNIKTKINSIGLLNEGAMDDPMFKIEGLIEKYEDKETNFGEVIVAKKTARQLKKEREKEYFDQKKKDEQYKKEILPFESMNLDVITNIMRRLEIQKSNILRMKPCEEKTKLLNDINEEMNRKVEFIQKMF